MLNLKELLYIQRSDRKMFLLILTLAVVGCLAIAFLGGDNTQTALTSAAQDSTALSRKETKKGISRARSYYAADSPPAEVFPFDPNTADSTQLLRLGLQPWQVRNIYKYRARGGIYRTKEDFARVYGLTQQQYRTLAPYIRIGADYQPAALLVDSGHSARRSAAAAYTPYKEYDRDTVRYPLKIKPGETVNLASLDTTMFKKVPGIGSGWARRIVSYGQRLGGYVHVGQLREIADFPEEALPYFIVQNAAPRKLNLNELTLNQLRRHPYIDYYQARAIIDYRRMKGPLKSLQQLSLHKDFSPEDIERLTPYVEF